MIAIRRTKSTGRPPRLRFQPSDLYKIRICKVATGEEIPLLVSGETGLPVVRPNQFILVARREEVADDPVTLYNLILPVGWENG